MVFNWPPVCCQTAMLISGVCCHGDCRLLSRMAGIKDQQFTEEKPLLPETRGQEPEMVSVCVRALCVSLAKYSRPVKNVPLVFWQ